MIHCIINISRFYTTLHYFPCCHVNGTLYFIIFVHSARLLDTLRGPPEQAKGPTMAEFVPLGEQIEMEDVQAEPTADRVRIIHCIHQYIPGQLSVGLWSWSQANLCYCIGPPRPVFKKFGLENLGPDKISLS